jgi:hypothetical protein
VKTFYSVQDIEDFAAQGKTELLIDENIVLTDLARHTARQLDISLVYKTRSEPAAIPPLIARRPQDHSSRPVRGSAAMQTGRKPKGCQHGPLTGQQPEVATVSRSSSSTVVDQLVGLVKRLGGKGD